MEREHVARPVARAGDFDGDGYDDILVGAVGYSEPDLRVIGRVYVYSGRTGETLRILQGNDYDEGEYVRLGQVIAGAGDIDGDPVPDIILGLRSFNAAGGWQSGKVYVISGESSEIVWSHEGFLETGRFGESVSFVPDIDGDGCSEVIVGEVGFGTGDIDFPGKVYLYSGATGELIWSRDGDAPADHFGSAVSEAGDFNRDGIEDVIVAANWNLGGQIYVLSGDTGDVIWHKTAEDRNDSFGRSVDSLGDMNGDGYDDVVVGASHADGAQVGDSAGRVYVFAGPSGKLLWSWHGEGVTDFLGFAVSCPGDVNGDGVPDVVSGAYSHDGPGGWNSGKAYVFSGATGSVIWSWTGEAGMDLFGYAVAGVGDVNGDGLADILIGAPWHDGVGGIESGKGYVFSPVTHADCDCSGEIDIWDFSTVVSCLNRGNISSNMDCRCADFNGDDHVDLRDFAVFQQVFAPPF